MWYPDKWKKVYKSLVELFCLKISRKSNQRVYSCRLFLQILKCFDSSGKNVNGHSITIDVDYCPLSKSRIITIKIELIIVKYRTSVRVKKKTKWKWREIQNPGLKLIPQQMTGGMYQNDHLFSKSLSNSNLKCN